MRYYETASHNIAAAVILPLADIVAVSLRFWVRMKQNQRLKADDWLLIPATVSLDDRHWDRDLIWSLPQGTRPYAHSSGRLEWAFDLMFPWAIGCTKASLLFFYLRIFSVNKWSKTTVFLKILISLVFIWSTAFFIAVLFTCKTNFAAIWGPTVNLYTICIKTLAKLEAICLTDFFADVIIIILPIPLIWHLKLSKGRKIGISAIFLLGIVSIAASLTRLVLISQLVFTGFIPTADEILLVTLEIYWAMVEVGIGILVACLPSLAILFKDLSWERVTNTARSLLRSSPRGSRSSQTGGNSISLSRMYDAEAGKAKNGWIRTNSSHYISTPAGDTVLEGEGSSTHSLPQIQQLGSYETSSAGPKQVPRDFVVVDG
ncbi:hypothetical protein O1611_g5060 [Lasiodiplodia mahajangana]|uniref:Uncharacterized protein n=1 Tax=Lasiodiplodia mahajangana TaxID=1108764 RepID=A0ACC2JMV9_9PEZI|nr:hypothetical protein O1611_g5060 [Lasiodiplodia mahajangana]